jgi:hypothetical protein
MEAHIPTIVSQKYTQNRKHNNCKAGAREKLLDNYIMARDVRVGYIHRPGTVRPLRFFCLCHDTCDETSHEQNIDDYKYDRSSPLSKDRIRQFQKVCFDTTTLRTRVLFSHVVLFNTDM